MLAWTDQDCNITACNSEGNSALHLALLEGTASVVGALMLYKADALKASTDKKSPLELAVAADAASGYVQAIVPHISEADINKPLPRGSTAFDAALVRASLSSCPTPCDMFGCLSSHVSMCSICHLPRSCEKQEFLSHS